MSKFDQIMLASIAATLAAIVLLLTSCVESVTISGKYADYKITPKKPIIIQEAK